MTTHSIIEVHAVRANELLTELSPHAGRYLWSWGYGPRDPEASWIFRGQSNSEDGKIWSLTPSAFRPGGWEAFANPAATHAIAEDAEDAEDVKRREVERREIERSRWEQKTLQDFVATADRYGFTIPDEDPIIRDPRLTETPSARDLNSAKFNPFPSPSMVATFALAQHYGLPTRLVDWSWRPLVAAYFACEGVARRYPVGHPRPPNEAALSVFALRTQTQHLFKEHDLDPRLVLITAATATNPNLRAQGGLFTLVQPQRADVPVPDLGALLETVERDIPSTSRWRDRFPLLVEFRIPPKEANWLLWQLSLLNITGAFVYPGLKGVVEALRERRYHQYELDCDDD